jgi:hypothetical protein
MQFFHWHTDKMSAARALGRLPDAAGMRGCEVHPQRGSGVGNNAQLLEENYCNMGTGTMRKCAECQLCCKLLPVEEIGKAAGHRCKHQKFGVGCSIYANRPTGCRLWSCLWLINEMDTADLGRPDRTHYVIDMMPDVLGIDDQKFPAMQVWCDPKYPDAHRDPALRRLIQRWAAKGILTLVRYDSWQGLAIFTPEQSKTGQWMEAPTNARDSEMFRDRVEVYKKIELQMEEKNE